MEVEINCSALKTFVVEAEDEGHAEVLAEEKAHELITKDTWIDRDNINVIVGVKSKA